MKTKHLILAAIISFFCVPAFSAKGAKSGGGNSGAKSKFALEGALYAGSGPSRNDDGTISSRVMNSGGVAVRVGWRFGWFVPRLSYNYESIGQAGDPSSVNNQNIGGTLYYPALGFKISLGNMFLATDYQGPGTFMLARKSTADEASSFSGLMGYEASLGYSPSSSFAFYLLFSQRTFSSNVLGSTNRDISNNKLQQNFMGIGIMSEIL